MTILRKTIHSRNPILLFLIATALCFSLLMMLLKLQYGLTQPIGDEPATPLLQPQNEPYIKFGNRLLTANEYSFIFYSCLYSLYPELKDMPANEIDEYISSQNYKSNDITIKSAMTLTAKQSIIDMCCYLQAAEDSGVEIDVSEQEAFCKEIIMHEAKTRNMDTEEYLSTYFGGCSYDQISNVIQDFLAYKKYKTVILKKASTEQAEQQCEEQYSCNKDTLDTYNFAYLILTAADYSGGDEEKEQLRKKVEDLYNNTHSLEDFERLSAEFSKDTSNGTVLTEPPQCYSYDELQMFGESIAQWVTNEERLQDSTALFEFEGKFAIIYFIGREKNVRDTFNGVIIHIEKGEQSFSDNSEYAAFAQSLCEKISESDILLSSELMNCLASTENSDIGKNIRYSIYSLNDELIEKDDYIDWFISAKNGSCTVIDEGTRLSVLYTRV